MNVIVPIPDDLVASLSGSASDLSRRALEALAAEECRAGRLTSAEVGRMLGIETHDAIDGFLKAHGVFNDYTVADLDHDMETLRNLGFRGLASASAQPSPWRYPSRIACSSSMTEKPPPLPGARG